MKQAEQIKQIIDGCKLSFEDLTEDEWSSKPNNNKWSKKEILGHLIDSALNNLRRFIVTQYQQSEKIVYEQDEWVKLQNYQNVDIKEVIPLWIELNKQIARVISIIPADKLNTKCDTGKHQKELHTLEFLIDDYIAHLRHHLAQIKIK